jgi:hypothetical protein
MHPKFYLTKNLGILDEFVDKRLQAGITSRNLGAQGAATEGVAFLATDFVWALQDPSETPDSLITSHL